MSASSTDALPAVTDIERERYGRYLDETKARITEIEEIVIARSQNQDLTNTQIGIIAVADLNGGLKNYLQELKEKEKTLLAKVPNVSEKPDKIVADILEGVSEEDLQQRLSNPHALVQSSGSEWDYQVNGEFKEKLCESFINNLEGFKQKELDKNRCSIPLIACGIGEGKSRALQEAPKLLKEALAGGSEAFSRVLVFQVSFENGTPVSKNLKTREQVPLRILYHLSNKRLTYVQFEREYGKQGLTLDDVLNYLAKGNERPLAVLLMIDGIHNLSENPIDLPSEDPLRVFLREDVCGSYILGEHPHFIYPLCSCTASISAIKALEESSTGRAWIPLPRLLDVPVLNEKPIQITPEQLSVMGGHGRAVEVLRDIIVENENQSMTDDDLFNEVVSRLVENKAGFKRFEPDHVAALVKASFLRDKLTQGEEDAQIKVGDKQFHVSTFTRHGLLRIEKQKLTIAPIWLLMNRKQEDGHILQGWGGAKAPSAEQWEAFGAWFRMFLSRLHEDGKTMNLRDFHKGMCWAENSVIPEFRNVVVGRVLRSRERISTKSDQKALALKQDSLPGNWEIQTRDGAFSIDEGSFVVLNAGGAPAGDSFIPLNNPKDEIFTEVYQQKWYTKQPIAKRQDQFKKFIKEEMTKAVGSNDVMIFSTNAAFPREWATFLEGKPVGVVHSANFEDYFGPFAAFWRTKKRGSSKTSPPKDTNQLKRLKGENPQK